MSWNTNISRYNRLLPRTGGKRMTIYTMCVSREAEIIQGIRELLWFENKEDHLDIASSFKDWWHDRVLVTVNDTIISASHDDVIKWKHIPRYWPFVRGIHQSPVNSPHKGQWCWALMFSLICTMDIRLSKPSRRRSFETLSCPLWRHCIGQKWWPV